MRTHDFKKLGQARFGAARAPMEWRARHESTCSGDAQVEKSHLHLHFWGLSRIFYLLVVPAPITSAFCCIVWGSRVIGARSLQRSLQSEAVSGNETGSVKSANSYPEYHLLGSFTVKDIMQLSYRSVL